MSTEQYGACLNLICGIMWEVFSVLLYLILILMGGKSTWNNENAENNILARIMPRRGRESCAARRVAATRAGSCRAVRAN